MWQLLPPSREAAERMLPVEVSTDDASYAFSRAPVEVADEFPVFLAELGPGDLLYVPVDYIHLVQIVEAINNLMKESDRDRLFDSRMLHNVIKKFTSFTKFHNQINGLWCV